MPSRRNTAAASQGMTRLAISKKRVGLARLHMRLGLVGLLWRCNYPSPFPPRDLPALAALPLRYLSAGFAGKIAAESPFPQGERGLPRQESFSLSPRGR